MSDADSDFDETAHEKLLESINNLGKDSRRKPLVRKCSKKVRAHELVDLIQSTRNLDDVKKKLAMKRKKKRKGKDAAMDEPRTLQAPIYRLARERIESTVAYSEVRKDLEEWAPVVKKNRLADQLVFPLEKDPPLERSGTERLLAFKPRTPLEIDMAELVGTSKNNFHNSQKYTEAELELLKAVNLKEAKAKWAQLRRMRAMIGYREEKLKRQAKIKSKSYHRHLKRQKRKKLIKEFEELLVKNPDAAKEKLEEINRQRILERATLKHRNGGKHIQQLARYASKNEEFKKTFEEQIRLGRELAEKHGREKDSDADLSASEDESTDPVKLSSAEMLQRAAEKLDKEELERGSIKPELKVKLQEMRKMKRIALKNSAEEAGKTVVTAKTTVAAPSTSHRVQNLDSETPCSFAEQGGKPVVLEWGTEGTLWDSEQLDEQRDVVRVGDSRLKENPKKPTDVKKVTKGELRKGRKKTKKKKGTFSVKHVDIDQLFDKAEKELTEAALEECERLKTDKEEELCEQKHIVSMAAPSQNFGKRKSKKTADEKVPMDISLDPRHFLRVETSVVAQVSADLMENLDEASDVESQEAIIAKAFEDVDVIGDFEAEKVVVEEAENSKDLDLTLQGWGSWTGPGIVNSKKDRFVIKAKKKMRKDAGRTGVIIAENVDKSIEKIQLRSIPFPYTTVEDYEVVVRQPLGKEWNPQKIHRRLIQPPVITKAGRIIKSLDRRILQTENMNEGNSEPEELL